MISDRQQAYMNSPHTNPYLKEVMRLTISIREMERKAFDKLPFDEKVMRCVECELEFIDVLKQKGYTEKTPFNGIPNYFPIKNAMHSIKMLTELLGWYEKRFPHIK